VATADLLLQRTPSLVFQAELVADLEQTFACGEA
jgi:hypothetical protein